MKAKSRNPRRNSSNSSTADQMADLGHFTSSSSSNLSPLAPPFTVERSNRTKLNSILDLDSNFNAKSDGLTTYSSIWPSFHSPVTTQGLSADSIRTATVLSANSSFPNPISSPSTHNWSSINSSVKSGLEPVNESAGHLFGANSAYSNPIHSPSTHNWSFNPNPSNSPNTHNWSAHPNPNNNSPTNHNWSAHPNPNNNSPATHNWSSMNSSIKSGLEPLKQPVAHLFDTKPNLQPTPWNFDDDDSDDDALLMPLNFDLLSSRSLFGDYGSSSSQVDYSQSVFGSKYSGQLGGSRGKEDSMFGGVSGVARENNIRPSVIGKSHDTSFAATNHGFCSTGFSNENTITWNGQTSRYPFETRSMMYDSFSDHISPSITNSQPSLVIKPPVTPSPFSAQGAVSTKSMEISNSPIYNSNKVMFSDNPLKEMDRPVGFEAKEGYLTSNLLSLETGVSKKRSNESGMDFEFKASSKLQVADINSTEDVKSAANLSEHLDHHNSAEDSPCWKGAPTQFSSSSGSKPGSSYSEPELSDGKVDHHFLHLSADNAHDLARADSLDVTNTLRILINFSEFLLLHCSMDESRLKEPEYMAVDHVIATLNRCMSRKTQKVDVSENDQERNTYQFEKNIEEVKSVTLKDDDLPKDYNMIQTIKKVLDENLECKEDLPSDTLMYKNLWLETEAELCAMSYKARFHRVKREMAKSKVSVPDVSEIATEIKKTSSSTFSPIAPKLIHEALRNKTSNTYVQNPSLPSVDNQIDDIENSVMARFNILKLRGESNPVNMAEKEPADVEASVNETQSSGMGVGHHLKHHLGKEDAVVMRSRGNQKMSTEDVDHAVMARLNILKCRGESDQQVLADVTHGQVSGKHSQSYGITAGPPFQHHAGKEEEVSLGSAGNTRLMPNWFESGVDTNYGAASDWEYVMEK